MRAGQADPSAHPWRRVHDAKRNESSVLAFCTFFTLKNNNNTHKPVRIVADNVESSDHFVHERELHGVGAQQRVRKDAEQPRARHGGDAATEKDKKRVRCRENNRRYKNKEG